MRTGKNAKRGQATGSAKIYTAGTTNNVTKIARLFFSADHHFGHDKILHHQADSRPYSSLHEMHKDFVKKWNGQVDHDDIVYYLGDLCYKNPEKYISKLNGEIHIIPGNHDKWIPKVHQGIKTGLVRKLTSASNKPVMIHGHICLLKHKDEMLVMCHYPMRSWPHSHFGSFHLHGHVHKKIAPWGLSMEVGVDNNNGYLYTWQDVKTEMAKLKHQLKEIKNEKD